MADEKKQNILPAISDDLMERIQALQELYRIGGKPSTIEQILDRSLTALVNFETERKDKLDG